MKWKFTTRQPKALNSKWIYAIDTEMDIPLAINGLITLLINLIHYWNDKVGNAFP